MSHDASFERTQAGGQFAAALALAHIVEINLPAAEWMIPESGRLCGHLKRVVDLDARIAMRQYATFLGGRLRASQGRNSHTEWVHLSVDATYRGVPVTVWTHVDVRPVAEVRS